MDVHCTTCNEPWDTHHLWHDAIFDTGISVEEAKEWRNLSKDVNMSPRYREEFKAAGYEFGKSVINVIRCPCCPKGAKPDKEKLETKALIESMLAGDEDGLACQLEDMGL